MAQKALSRLLLPLSIALIAANIPASIRAQSKRPLGIFESQSDVGSVVPAGTATYDEATKSYTITAAGENMWLKQDAFHYLYKKASGDLALTADIVFPNPGGNEHRKAALVLRQTLDADAIYADASVHGNGMTAIQYRPAKAAFTQDVELNIQIPRRIRIEKRGDTFTMFISEKGEPLHPAGATIYTHLEGTFYIGLAVCSHNKDVTEKAIFSNVDLEPLSPLPTPDPSTKPAIISTLQTISIEPQYRRSIVVYSAPTYFEAPNWSRDGKTLIFDQGGKIMTVSAEGGTPQILNTGAAINCTGSHGLSPDGKLLAISCAMPDKPGTRVYTLPSTGGEPHMVTENPASYWHTWSPDGKTLVFVRPHEKILDLVAIPVEGSKETKLTDSTGISDDPDYSPDGKYIYFNSNHGGGTMQIWRMHPDGTHPDQVTSDQRNNWTPHPSPDGKWIVYLSYDMSVTDHAVNKDVQLRLLSTADNSVTTLVSFFGGSGSFNVPSWAPDSHHLAYVSYQLVPATK